MLSEERPDCRSMGSATTSNWLQHLQKEADRLTWRWVDRPVTLVAYTRAWEASSLGGLKSTGLGRWVPGGTILLRAPEDPVFVAYVHATGLTPAAVSAQVLRHELGHHATLSVGSKFRDEFLAGAALLGSEDALRGAKEGAADWVAEQMGGTRCPSYANSPNERFLAAYDAFVTRESW